LGILIRLIQYWTENPRERVLRIKKRETHRGPWDTTGIVKKYPFWILMGITVPGGVVRYWGIHFEIPGTVSRPDEEFIVATALQFFKGDFNPEFFNYPTLYMYLPWSVPPLFSGHLGIRNESGRSRSTDQIPGSV
jgi:hypothetical protein